MFQEDLLDKIMDLPDAPDLVRRVADKLNDETQRRHKFYNDIEEMMFGFGDEWPPDSSSVCLLESLVA